MAEASTLGDTLNDRFRGPEGAVGGGVCAWKGPACPPRGAVSDLGDAKGGLGEMEA